MLDFRTIESIAARLASERLGKSGLERVLARPSTDSEGKDAVRVTVVLAPQAASELSGDDALDLLTELNQALEHEGEERFAVVEYATEAEMREDEEETRERDEQERGFEADEN